ncbi:hypothetical protein [Chitinophaga sp.]|uniref:hypothetical protein n=1 Tax=Chitinophaga sp. TaxID=1869181 RepID=UPI0031E42A95
MSVTTNVAGYRLTITSHCLLGTIERYSVNIELGKKEAHGIITVSSDGKYYLLDITFDVPTGLQSMYHFCKGLIALGEDVLIEAVKYYCDNLYS